MSVKESLGGEIGKQIPVNAKCRHLSIPEQITP